MKYIRLILLSACPLLGQSVDLAAPQKIEHQKFYQWSVAALAAGNVADAASSWRRPEANPVLANPGAAFGTQSLLLKSGLLGTSLLLERWALRHNPRLYKPFAWMNFAVGGGLGAVAARNASLP